MRHLIKTVMSYPPGYVPSDWEAPEGYVPEGCIEDYALAFGAEAPVVGQQLESFGHRWTVAQVQIYRPLEEIEPAIAGFYLVICTLDGSIPDRESWHDGNAPLLVVHANAEGELATNEFEEAHWELVEREEWISPQDGEIQQLQHFEPVAERIAGDYDKVIVARGVSARGVDESSAA
jgi:hypothetical protein